MLHAGKLLFPVILLFVCIFAISAPKDERPLASWSIEDLQNIVILPKGVFASGTTRLYVDSVLEPGFCWGRTYDLKLNVQKYAMPSVYLAQNSSAEYFSDMVGLRRVVLEKKTVLSEDSRKYEIIVY